MKQSRHTGIERLCYHAQFKPMKNTVSIAFDSLEQTSRWFLAFCLFHMAFFTLFPAFIRPQLSMDSVEGVAWGNQWQWGIVNTHF